LNLETSLVYGSPGSSDEEKALSHRHGALASRAEELARLQVFKILLSLRRHHQSREPLTLSCPSDHHFAEVLAQRQPRKRPDDILRHA
jgi:hypothetical protein